MTASRQPISSKKGYLPTLDGWRAIAIAMVLLNHDRLRSIGSHSTQWFRINGGMGVEVFFALSGVLICTRLLQEEKIRGRIDLRGFYVRRLCRIQPAALLYLSVIGILMLANVLDREPREMLCSILLVRNIFPLHSPPGSWYTAHFWSLSVEEHFYLLLPGFLLLVRKHRARYLTALVLLLEIWIRFVYHFPQLQFGSEIAVRTDVAIDVILLGALAAILLDREPVEKFLIRFCPPWVTLPLAVCWWIWCDLHPVFARVHLLLICIYPLVILSTMLHPQSLTGRFLELPVFRFIGKISYSLYLWQMLFFTYNKPIPAPHSAILQFMQHTPLRYGAVLAASLISYYLVEKPMMRLGHRLARPATQGRADLNDAPQQTISRSA
jgi:peptidoglycan/LPS O-acetylase OafA/YrhL